MELVIVTIAIVAAISAAVYLLDEIIWVFTSSVKVIVLTLKAAVKAVFSLKSWVREAIRSFRSCPPRLLIIDSSPTFPHTA